MGRFGYSGAVNVRSLMYRASRSRGLSQRARSRVGFVALVAAAALPGCIRSGADGGAPGTSAIELADEPTSTFTAKYRPDLVQVDRSSVTQSVFAMSPDASAFVFNHAPASILKATPGTTVLLAGLALRKISAIETNGNYALVHTAPATLTDAIQDGTIAWDHAISFGASGKISGGRHFTPGIVEASVAPVWLFSITPALASDGGSVAVTHSGTAKGWDYVTRTTVGADSLAVDETLTWQDASGMQITMHAKGTLSNFRSSVDIEIQHGRVLKFTYLIKDLKGTFDFQWQATKSAPGVGTLPDANRLVALPPLVSIPLDFEGIPFTLNVDSAVLIRPGFTASDEGSQAHFTVNFNGDLGFTVANDQISRVGAVHGNVDIGADTNAVSPIAASTFVGALSFPKLELIPGIVYDALLPTNGAFADRAKKMLSQSGYSQLSPSEGLPAGDASVQLITAGGLYDFGTMDALVPCQQATIELSLKMANGSSLGVSSSKPNETYPLKTWHHIDPPVHYCEQGLTADSATSTGPTPAVSCDQSATGSDTDFYGVMSGKEMQPFLAVKGSHIHGGIDVQNLRDGPVFANIRDVVSIDAFNSAKMYSASSKGLRVPGSGTAHLVDATVLRQPWPPGCPEQVWCSNPTVDDSYGGIVGLAAHYSYGNNQILTVYIEYEHLIAKKYPPRNDNGTFVDNQGQPIGSGDYVAKNLGCYLFGSMMQDQRTLSAEELHNHPLIGYLGATENPHVHIQAAFGFGRQGYMKTNLFDPGVVLVH
jgi:hypothetical protein